MDLMMHHPADLPLPVLPRLAPQPFLAGQRAIVTGASSGIGRAIALALGQAGADVAINFISGEDKAEEAAAQIREHGVRAMTVRCDVSDETQVRDMFKRTIDAFGTVDILVNNAGLQQDAPLEDMTLDRSGTRFSASISPDSSCARARRYGSSNAGAWFRGLQRGGKDHMHQFRARSDSVGRARELCGVERRRDVDDEEHCAGSGALSDQSQQHLPGGDKDAD